MSLLKPKRKGKSDSDFRQISLLAAVPGILLAAPLIGFFGGKWLDGKFDTDPYLMMAGVVLGFAAAGLEIYGLAKKSEAMEKENEEQL
ncbi:MAG: AtpZ/AtpI family protein [bacterium]|nr:AtpZ/AtpI family protein [bacterium]